MQFSSRLTVAVHILLCIEELGKSHKITSSFLAGSVNVNPVIIRKTIGQLKRAGLVQVKAGVGGVSFAKKPEDISLWDVFKAVEASKDNLFRFHENPNPECPVGRNIQAILGIQLDKIEELMKQEMKKTDLRSLIAQMHKRIQAQNKK